MAAVVLVMNIILVQFLAVHFLEEQLPLVIQMVDLMLSTINIDVPLVLEDLQHMLVLMLVAKEQMVL